MGDERPTKRRTATDLAPASKTALAVDTGSGATRETLARVPGPVYVWWLGP